MPEKTRRKTKKDASAKAANAAPKRRNLKLDRETLKDLDAVDANAVRGGWRPSGGSSGVSTIDPW